MPRNISFAHTTPQFLARTKTVTRRNGWRFLKAGDTLMACRKVRGLKQGEELERLGPIRVVSVRTEPLHAITAEDVVLEGYPEWTREQFIEHYCRINNCSPEVEVTRIEFAYL